MGEETFWSPEALAQTLGIPLRTIYNWRTRGEGPRAFKIGRHVRYKPADVALWLEAQADKPRERVGGA